MQVEDVADLEVRSRGLDEVGVPVRSAGALGNSRVVSDLDGKGRGRRLDGHHHCSQIFRYTEADKALPSFVAPRGSELDLVRCFSARELPSPASLAAAFTIWGREGDRGCLVLPTYVSRCKPPSSVTQ